MTDLEEFRRFNAGVCNPAVVDAADRFLEMLKDEAMMGRIYARWAHEDKLKREAEQSV